MSSANYGSTSEARVSELMIAVQSWRPRGRPSPTLSVEARHDGVRVKLTYLEVEIGVVFAYGSSETAHSVHATLDRLFDVLSWRVTRPPSLG